MYFDDLPKGFTFETGTRTLGEDEILAFARQWDPQDFHTDPEAAKASPYGGLIASGFHSMLTAFNLILDANVWNTPMSGTRRRWARPAWTACAGSVRSGPATHCG
jgi:acyl dehydratase